MQADLDIHRSDVRLRVHSQLAEMDENLLSVWPSGGPGYVPSIYHHQTDILTQNLTALLHILQKNLLPCEAESQKRNFLHRANCRRCVRCVSDDQNVNDKTVRPRI
ncbi:hypothetical protein Tsp_04783 [Trichinella spiralis]|uniref:hypothetical protein n=1 Tax=Trichinella spiralis TaxID=6334 RepID=UPI0001EFDE0D|nr:hypothetical protein Tsp_04783 [Trichinella spiralis]